jgi:hypothetical protein
MRRIAVLSQLMSQTPPWVFAVFMMLLVLGLLQSKPRTVAVKTVLILPLAMLLFSLFGVYSAFQLSFSTIGGWGIGFALALWGGLKLAQPKQVRFSVQDNQFTIPGSWTPLALMMAIFMTKFFVGFAIARHLSIIDQQSFSMAVAVLYGAFSGIFVARGLVMYQARLTPVSAL